MQVLDTTNPTETFHKSKNKSELQKETILGLHNFYQTNYLATYKEKRMQCEDQEDNSFLNIFVPLDIFDANYDCP